MLKTEYNSLVEDIGMKKIELNKAEQLLKGFNGKWIYIKLISNIGSHDLRSQTGVYSKFRIRHINISHSDILIYGREDDDRLFISKNILVQSECTYTEDTIKLIQKTDNIFYSIYIQSYLPPANLRLDEITHSTSNLIITEGKTDWKHLKNSLFELQKQNKYLDLDFKFFEYEDDVQMSNGKLLNVCRYQSLFENDYLKVFVFDSDDPNINKEHENQPFKYYGNNVYSLILPVPKHRLDTPLISIENYYTDEEITLSDENGRRLYLAKEFDKITSQHLIKKNIYALKVNKDMENNHVIDDKVYQINNKENILKEDIYSYNNKTNIALTKNNFATYILGKVSPFDKISSDTFSLVFDIISKIKQDYINQTDDYLEISEGVYLQNQEDKKILHINFALPMEDALQFRKSTSLACAPEISENKTTLYLNISSEYSDFCIPLTISDELIEFLYAKLNNFSNRIELHLFNEHKELISNRELFQGHNTSSIGVTLVLRKILS